MKKLILLIVIISFTSCINLVLQQLWYIKKNMSYNEVTNIIDSDDYNKSITYISNKQNDTHNLTNVIEKDSKVLLTYRKIQKYHPFNNSYYAFYFKEDKLVYWGLIYEFARHKNPELNKVAEEISKIIREKYEKSE